MGTRGVCRRGHMCGRGGVVDQAPWKSAYASLNRPPSVQALLYTRARAAQAADDRGALDLVQLSFEAQGVIVAYLPGLHMAQRRRQRMALVQRPMRIVGVARLHGHLSLPPHQIMLLEILVGLR